MTDEELKAARAEQKEIENAYRADYAHIQELAAAWVKKWPNHCAACGGWGGATFCQSHPYGSTTASEELLEPCEALPPEVCHRCGEAGLNEDSEGPCNKCGWDFDDGKPEY